MFIQYSFYISRKSLFCKYGHRVILNQISFTHISGVCSEVSTVLDYHMSIINYLTIKIKSNVLTVKIEEKRARKQTHKISV